jgi:phosphoketolase
MTEVQERRRMSLPEIRTTLDRVDAWWRAANHIAAGFPGGSRPAVAAATLAYAHLNRMIVRREHRMGFVLGVGDAAPALAAIARMEGATATPAAAPRSAGCAYALAYAIGAALDEPGLTVAAMIDEDALSAWQARAQHNPVTDGAVLPILYQPSMDRAGVRGAFAERGWEPIEICSAEAAADMSELHRCFAAGLYVALDEIAAITDAAASGRHQPLARWPMLVVRTPVDWPPAGDVPDDWFDTEGFPVADIAAAGPTGHLRMSAG